jgi:hypothetical protein
VARPKAARTAQIGHWPSLKARPALNSTASTARPQPRGAHMIDTDATGYVPPAATPEDAATLKEAP